VGIELSDIVKVEVNGHQYQVEVIDIDVEPIIALVDGEKMEIVLDDSIRKTEKSTSDKKMTEVKSSSGLAVKKFDSPMPGVILSINVKVGDVVTAGEQLCILEAMKMEQQLYSDAKGKVESINISVGDKVMTGQTLIVFS
jgi:biotin carboxyl carrier protein